MSESNKFFKKQSLEKKLSEIVLGCFSLDEKTFPQSLENICQGCFGFLKKFFGFTRERFTMLF